VHDCCDDPIIEDTIEADCRFRSRSAVYLGNGYYVRQCVNCGAVISSDYMSNAVQYEFDPCGKKYYFRKGANLKKAVADDDN
jgi:hypothetical protein